MNGSSRIVCVSNRLPLSAIEEADKLEFRPSSGGLVTAIAPVLRKCSGKWIGWPGSLSSNDEQVQQKLTEFSAHAGFELYPVRLDQEAVKQFYLGFSNQIIWPLFHDLQNMCNFEPAYWSTYLRVQEVFREAVLKHAQPGDLIWVHDYHLMGLGRYLRNAGCQSKICFFLHTPFPPPDIFLKLPWRNDVMDSLLSYNLLGFQAQRDLKNFMDCVQAISAYQCTRRGPLWNLKVDNREINVGSFPISIDFNEFEEIARLPDVEAKAQQIRTDMNAEYLILSMDRLDYTKGIPYRIRAFKRLLEMEPSLKRRVALLQVVVPSRVEVPEYKQLRTEIEQLVSELNGAHGEPGWVPVQHLFRSLTREEVVAMYRASDVALVTPLKDGMNLVAKEYCASRINNGGALILSEFAGAAEEFRNHSFLVNPYDIEGVARALSRAFSIARDQAKGQMQDLRLIVKRNDVYAWASSFLKACDWEWHSGTEKNFTSFWERLRRLANVFDN